MFSIASYKRYIGGNRKIPCLLVAMVKLGLKLVC